VNLSKASVEVVEALTVVRGRVEVGPIKNGVRRTIAITTLVRDDVAAHLTELGRELGRPLVVDDLVFRAPNGGPLRRDLLYKRMILPVARP
jgi:hypothetical protein